MGIAIIRANRSKPEIDWILAVLFGPWVTLRPKINHYGPYGQCLCVDSALIKVHTKPNKSLPKHIYMCILQMDRLVRTPWLDVGLHIRYSYSTGWAWRNFAHPDLARRHPYFRDKKIWRSFLKKKKTRVKSYHKLRRHMYNFGVVTVQK